MWQVRGRAPGEALDPARVVLRARGAAEVHAAELPAPEHAAPCAPWSDRKSEAAERMEERLTNYTVVQHMRSYVSEVVPTALQNPQIRSYDSEVVAAVS